MVMNRLLGVLVLGATCCLSGIQVSKLRAAPAVEEIYVKQPSSVGLIPRFCTAGYGAFAGSISWVETIFSFANATFSGESPRPVVLGMHLSTALDSLWPNPPLIAAWAVPQLKGFTTKDALPFLKYGAERFPTEWQFRLTWAQYVLDARDIDSVKARDSASSILLPLASSSYNKVPQYARNLAFTLMHKNGKPEEAMSLLLQTYAQVPDPMVRYQFRGKMGDLLWRNRVRLGTDSTDFLGGLGALLESKDPAERRMAGQILFDLVDSTRRERALVAAHQLAGEYAAYSKK